jgi:sulfite exporter TauE/SafE
MDQYLLAFVTGLTTGGLSCLAVQGGLLASSLAHQIEQDMLQAGMQKSRRAAVRPRTVLPILLFLVAKLAAYTLLGALLGLLGSFLTPSPTARAILMIAIGIFMLGNALRMLNVHPVFRYFAIEPPKFITRYIRRQAKDVTEIFTPLFLGALTVFIPCGVTQAMMAAALATGSASQAAALMFAFTLGTSPVFFLVAYLTTELGARLEKWFMRFVAIVVLALGLVTLNSGLNLMGSPLAFDNLTRRESPFLVEYNPGATQPVQPVAAASDPDTLTLNAANQGYFPRQLSARSDAALTLNVVTQGTYSCARDFVIPALGFYQLLPETGVVPIPIPPQPAGTVMRFTCSMGMYTGEIVFE